MRAYRLEQFKTIEDLVLHDEEPPKPGRHEVLVRVRASSLNYRDLAILHGNYPMSCAPGHIPLSDGAGEVVELGDGAERFEVGSRVANTVFPRWFGGRYQLSFISEQYGSNSDGWLTEYKVVNEEALVSIPAHLSFEEAATLPCAAVTAWSALAGITAGDTILTQGSGGVSLFAVQLAKLLGARVIATTSSMEKMVKLKSLGADDVINYMTTPDWDGEVRRLTNGQGVDRVVEVGGPGTLQKSIKSCAIGGEVVLIGFLASSSDAIDFMNLFMGGVSLRRIAVGSRDDFENMNRAITQHKLRPVIDHVFPFMDAKEAWQYFDDRKHFGKVVIAH
ncbi:NAD(P)-dependent alcohol dehydrogenase [Ferrovum sp.]|uniref:zinc-dependent alcohol dehydrogenase family protein n=1 Tax=Ferrovum sp. TaxID=2609467 RepID=UPI002606F19A|nr:NAD(P)-dependent alcohol dehydrogenase [Ferrovum sp.]